MGHFLRLLFTRRWGWALIGVLIIGGGVLWGVSSPTIPYQVSPSTTTYFISAVPGGDIYIWTTDQTNPTVYIARHSDFNPAIDSSTMTLKSYLSFIARSDTIYVDENLTNHFHATQAHIIEQLTLYDSNQHPTGTYSASSYTSGTSGYYDNRWWPGGSATIAAGLLLAYIALFVRRKKRAPAADQNDPNWPFNTIPTYPADATQGQQSSKS